MITHFLCVPSGNLVTFMGLSASAPAALADGPGPDGPDADAGAVAEEEDHITMLWCRLSTSSTDEASAST